MSDGERYVDIVFPEYYEDVFTEEDLDFRFRLIRGHIHPKLRTMLTGALGRVADILETDPHTFSKIVREPRTNSGDANRLQCALYSLRPNEVRGPGYPNLRSSSGRGRQVADFDLSFFAERDGLGLELHIGRREELKLLREVYSDYREEIDALLMYLRLAVDGPTGPRLKSLSGMIELAEQADGGWLAIFEQRCPYPFAADDIMGRFEECMLALYLIYDAMLSRALGIEDHFREHFGALENHFVARAQIDEQEPPRFS